jgi:predicted phage baseplate assembly protein
VARASHGETVKEEILGDGDAAAKFQSFTLQKQPLTHVPSADPGGLKSSLKILVNRVLWQEAPSLYGQAPGAQVHTTRIADDGSVTVQFGDNVTGATPFSGRGNIMAIYRHGLGLAGRVRANTLTTLLDRPVGLKSVTNPQPAEGGADPETLDAARENAPLTVRTFGRAVSLRDFEDLVTATGEVAKAKATWVWNGQSRAVHLTVAGQAAGTFSPAALSRIHASLTAQRDPNHTLFLDNFVRVPLVIAAAIHIAAAYVAADVEQAARTALLGALSFDALRFGQPLHLSDIYRVLQNVPGVVWVKIDLLQFKDQSPAYLAARGADAQPVQEHLRIFAARILPALPAAVLPAEQAWIEAPTQDITLLTSGGLPI